MKDYIGVKHVQAEPMTLGTYNKYRGWQIPENEDPNKEGYLVRYTNSDNYESWSPKEVFDESHNEMVIPLPLKINGFHDLQNNIWMDPSYEHTWFANITMLLQDSGVPKDLADERAKDFMNTVFAINQKGE